MITSTSNNKIKNIIKCVKSSKERKKQDVFVVEGLRMFLEIPEEMHVETYVTEEFYERNRQIFEERQGFHFELVTPHVMEAMAGTKTPQGVLSLVSQFHYSIEEVMSQKNSQEPLVIALEKLQDPGNLGTIIRTAEGAGVTGIIMSRDTVDIYNPKVVRATMGSIFRMHFCYVGNFVEWLKECSDRGIFTYGAHIKGKNFYDNDYQKPTIFCIGNEGNGLSDEASEAVIKKIFIPMKGKVESLNAATAATVLMYEALRQRNKQFRQN